MKSKKAKINKAWYIKNRARRIATALAYYHAHKNDDPDGRRLKNKIANRVWRLRHPESAKTSIKKWQHKNRARCAEFCRARQAKKVQAMPVWVDRSKIVKIYEKAVNMTKKTGIKHEVDHVWPLRGNGFTGLHVPWNLRVIPMLENRMKGNRVTVPI